MFILVTEVLTYSILSICTFSGNNDDPTDQEKHWKYNQKHNIHIPEALAMAYL